MSMTVSMGVWSVIVIGAISRIFFNFNGAGPRACPGGAVVNITIDWPLIPSTVLFAFAKIKHGFIKKKKTNQLFFYFNFVLTDG